jgi:hypothetical protein
MAYAIERLKDRGKGIPLVGVAFNGDQNVKWTVIVDDAQASYLAVLTYEHSGLAVTPPVVSTQR